MEKRKRIEWIDALRGFACVLVIIGHISSIPNWLFKWIYGFHLPLFFTISGYLFNLDKWKKAGFKQLMFSKAKSYLIPFFVLGIFIAILENSKILIFSNVIYWEEYFKYLKDYILWIIFQIDGDFCGGLIGGSWFLPTIFISILLLYFVLTKNKYFQVVYIFISMLIIKYTCHNSILLPWHIDTAFLGSIFMYCGYLINKFDILTKLKNNVLKILVFILANYFIIFNNGVDFKARLYSNYHYMFFGGFLMTLFLLLIFNELNIRSSTLKLFGVNSVFIMCLNFPIYRVLEKLFNFLNIGLLWPIYIVVELLIFLILLLLLDSRIKNSKFLSIIFGK